MKFPDSYKKIKRAHKHIADIQSMVRAFGKLPDSYSLWVERDNETGQNFLCVDFRWDLFPSDDIALTIGDALHNLRSALDFMYYQIVNGPTNYTRFPIFDDCDALVSRWINSALKQGQLTSKLGTFIVDVIKPYEAGNPLLMPSAT
jgi:hypothetical protein